MTRRHSLTIGVAVVAMAVGVPTALGKGQPQSAVEYFNANKFASLVQSGEPSAVEYFKANEFATLVQSGEPTLAGYRDAHERLGTVHQPAVATYRDSFERTHMARTGLESNVGSYRDAFERSNPQTTPVTRSPASSGTEIEWPQVGIGLGLGLVLALGFWLAMRYTRIRPLTH